MLARIAEMEADGEPLASIPTEALREGRLQPALTMSPGLVGYLRAAGLGFAVLRPYFLMNASTAS